MKMCQNRIIAASLFVVLLAAIILPSQLCLAAGGICVYPLGDINQDKVVDLNDLGILCGRWLESDCNGANGWCGSADLDQSGNIDLIDYALLAADWGAMGNCSPIVIAGPNQVITLPAIATLNGEVTDDGLPNPPGQVITLWTKQSGPGTVTFGDASAAVTTGTFSATGTYVLRLTANDGLATSFDQMTVTVNPSSGTYEGYAPMPTGGAGGTTVHVTNLNDSGTGSYRAVVGALTGSPTIIVFDVSGVICTTSETRITAGNVTVDGSSAPGDGITFAANTGAAGPPLGIKANNVIVNNLRVCQIDPANVSECIGIWGGTGIVVDHCSMTNAGDSSIFITAGQNITLSRCLFGGDVEAMRGHGYYVSMHHCFFSWNNRRQPRIYETTGPWDLRNCIVDNWTGTGTNVLLASNVNIINNWYGNPAPKPGEDCSAGFLASSLSGDTNVYINGNDSNCGQNIDGLTQISSPNPEPNVTTELASAVPADVLGDVGAQPNDAVDQYYIDGGGLNPPLPPSCSGGSSSGGGGGGIGWSETADYYVDGLVGSDTNAGTSSAPWATLTKAVSTATAGKKVLVWGGQASGVTYTGQLTFSNSGTSSSPITFRRDPASGTATIDGNGTTSGTLYTTSAKYIVIDGFTIQNGKYGVYTYGSGATNWTIRNCRITGSQSYGIYNRSGAGMTIFNDAVYLNGGTGGYGIYIYDTGATATISQCDVYGQKYGINNSTTGATSTVTNSIVSGNSGYGIYNKSSTITITYTDVYGQSTNYFGCSAGTGCISADPLWDDPGSGVFTLGTGSPCIGKASDGKDMGYRLGDTAL